MYTTGGGIYHGVQFDAARQPEGTRGLIEIIEYPATDKGKYLELLAADTAEHLASLADQLRGVKTIHINSTAYGGGVAELLHSLIPLSNALGVETQRVVMTPKDRRFFDVTKRIHNMLQGAEGELSEEELAIYYGCLDDIADEINGSNLQADVWYLHDPQLLPLGRLLKCANAPRRIWIVHIDLTQPNPWLLDELLPLTSAYDAMICSLRSYVPSRLAKDLDVFIAPPAIDPLTLKNSPMAADAAATIIDALGIDVSRPLVTQVSRFDVWKDPWGVIDAFRLARCNTPGLQLALLGLSQADDDPEGAQVLQSVQDYAGADPDIHLYFSPEGLPASNDEIVNALQSHSQVLVQKSTREGFGLTVSEAMWKGKPVIGGNVGGIRLQIEDGESGYLVDSAEQAGERMAQLLANPALRARIGAAARERVRQRFLIPRLLDDYWQVASQLKAMAA